MPRYIDADALFVKLQQDDSLKHARNLIRLYVDEAPTADVAPVVRGEWEKVRFSRGIMACSACGYYFQESQMPHRNFCPACGARMKGGA